MEIEYHHTAITNRWQGWKVCDFSGLIKKKGNQKSIEAAETIYHSRKKGTANILDDSEWISLPYKNKGCPGKIESNLLQVF